MRERLAVDGGPEAMITDDTTPLDWPIVTDADERAALAVLSRGAMSDTDVTRAFEDEFAA